MTSKEALEDIILYLNATEPKGLYCENIEVIKQDLERLEAIDNANSSEAMESLERIDKEYATIENEDFKICFNTIKQALLKAQEQEKENKVLKACIKDWEDDYEHLEFYFKNREKALDIIKNKKVNMYHIWVFDNYQQYKEHYPFSEYHAIEDMLSENEFILLKEVFG